MIQTQLHSEKTISSYSRTEPAFRNDARAKVLGIAQYADDYEFPRMVHAVPVWSESVRARILRIHKEKAQSMPGVLAVLSADDIPGCNRVGQIDQDFPLLAQDEIRYAGEPYALVVAQTRSQALDAARYVELESKELPVVLHPEDALDPDAPFLRATGKTNLVAYHRIRRGESAAVFESADIIVEKEFYTGWFEHAYLEAEGAVCFPRQDSTLEIYGSLQHPVSTRKYLSAWLNIPYSRIEVFNHPVGGSFGGKDDTASAVAGRAALAALAVKRPVKIIYEREWSFLESYKRPPYKLHYKAGFDRDGHFVGVDADILADSGPYTSTIPWSTWRSAVQCCGPYKVPFVRTEVRAAATNNSFTGAFRGFGAPQVNFAVESIMDEAAEMLNLSPVKIRQRNILRQGDSTITGQVLSNHRVSLDEVLSAVCKEIDFEENFARCSFGEGKQLYGIGLALSYRGASVGSEAKDFSACIVNCQFDGSILMETGIHENGQGAQSAMILALSHELGVSVERIHYAESTTHNVPESGTTVASRGTLMGTGAIVDAAAKLRQLISDTITAHLGGDTSMLIFQNDEILCDNPRGQSWKLSWDEAMKIMYEQRVYPFAFGSFQAPEVSWNDETGQGDPYFTYVYSCQAVELRVEENTIIVDRVVAAHDAGRVINLPMFEGQIKGGIVQGLGMALKENFVIKDGRPQNLNYNTYKIPNSADVPQITIVHVQNKDPLSPFGCKGIGEPATELIAPAIGNALYNATGKRSYTLPLLPKGAVGPWKLNQ